MDLFEAHISDENPPDNGYENQPLATRMRPATLDECVGQEHLIGEGKILHRMITSGVIGSMIFYGPPSSGKTTLAHVISREIEIGRAACRESVLKTVCECECENDSGQKSERDVFFHRS